MRRRTIIRRSVAFMLVTIITLGVAAVAHLYYFRPPTVKTSLAMLGPVSEVVYGTGIVEPVRWAKVVPVNRKRVVELCRCEGQSVKAGQVLGRQDDAEEQAALKELEIRRDQLNRDLQRLNRDRQEGKIPKTEYEHQESQFKELESRITAQKERLDTLVFRAPMDGMVLRRDGEVGEIVGPTDVMFWVGLPTTMQVVAEINEEEITKIAVGQKAFLQNEAFSTQSLPATVSQITPKGDPTRKTFRVYLMLPRDSPLRIGMTVEANIVFREKPAAVVVPSEAVIDNSVQVVSSGKIQRVPVTIGVRGTRYLEIIGNVSQGATVLSPARVDLADGAAVRMENAPAKDAPNASTDPLLSLMPATTSRASSDETEQIAAENAVISAAIIARIQSIVSDARRNDARRNASKYNPNR
jgi:RND family efflux transporter MFP subunit